MMKQPERQPWQVALTCQEFSRRIAEVACRAQLWFLNSAQSDLMQSQLANGLTVRQFLDDIRQTLDRIEEDCKLTPRSAAYCDPEPRP
jgi:hypothetical protein